MFKLIVTILLIIFIAGGALGDESVSENVLPADSAFVESDTMALDIAMLLDSAVLGDTLSLEDSIRIVFPDVDLDTLTEAQRLYVEFDTRYKLRKPEAPPEEILPEF
ncbi:MAG: hypothetical protein DRP45_07790, partial [Candidatus Zixiibacteriota bacterium]